MSEWLIHNSGKERKERKKEESLTRNNQFRHTSHKRNVLGRKVEALQAITFLFEISDENGR